ncbi:response regulator transcription factor [Flavobacterium sp. HXWNR29]|uniref:response regulator transcription factor n=1 Tax=Flavobacterium odoriferum TaxID=2946604 RepID=UPI0021CAFCFF|nr:response regulator transcription factor [Flavobacterium sp. HXWNR29]MCU4189429.1 response regulator transcription factor [Flavobacterium sp. HXWNR29]
MSYKILIVDDHMVVKTGVSIILNSEINDLDIQFASTFSETLDKVKQFSYDLIILDINIPGGKNIEMIPEIRAIVPEVKILMFSAHEEEFYALRYVSAGADGFLNKLSSEEKLIDAVRSIREFGKYLTENLIDQLNNNLLNDEPLNPFDKLSKREIEIANLLVRGDGNLEISNNLGIQMSTVSTYKNRIFEKLKINNLVELIEKHHLHCN